MSFQIVSKMQRVWDFSSGRHLQKAFRQRGLASFSVHGFRRAWYDFEYAKVFVRDF